MTDTEKGAREVFKALKRPGECWHETERNLNIRIGGTRPDWHYRCKHCLKSGKQTNPDPSTPEGAFWIMERLLENLDIDVEFTKAKRYYASILTDKRQYRGTGDSLADALYSAVLAWVREK